MNYLELFLNTVVVISVPYYIYTKRCSRVFSYTCFYKVFGTKAMIKTTHTNQCYLKKNTKSHYFIQNDSLRLAYFKPSFKKLRL